MTTIESSTTIPNMSLLTRKATLTDTPSVYRLICALEDTHFAEISFNKLYQENLAVNHVEYFVAEIDGQVVGFASVHINLLLHHCGKVAEIQELVVNDQYRNQQIGRQLVQHIIE